jgi:hypothetical protein
MHSLLKTRENHVFRNTKREMAAQESVYLDRREMAFPEGSMALVKGTTRQRNCHLLSDLIAYISHL